MGPLSSSSTPNQFEGIFIQPTMRRLKRLSMSTFNHMSNESCNFFK